MNGQQDMPKNLTPLALPPLWLAISSCIGQRANIAYQAIASLIGRTKEEVLACMGAPPQQAKAGYTEVWSYTSGGDTTTWGFAGTSYSIRRYCVVNIVMSGDRVSVVNYVGRTGG
jgi:pyruvate/2-oxoacid:ferredoxin oxidoreductase beta subunit